MKFIRFCLLSMVLVSVSSCCKLGSNINAVVSINFENFSIEEVAEISNEISTQSGLLLSFQDNTQAIRFEFLHDGVYNQIGIKTNDSTTLYMSNVLITDLDDNNGRCDGGKNHQLASSFKFEGVDYEVSKFHKIVVAK